MPFIRDVTVLPTLCVTMLLSGNARQFAQNISPQRQITQRYLAPKKTVHSFDHPQ